MIKEFKTFDEQLNILLERRLTIKGKESAFKIIESENYYNVINGYKKPFLDTNYSKEIYKKNSSFEEIYELYKFDRHIRNIAFNAILQVENTLRTQISYVFSKYHGSVSYLNYENFETLVGITTDKKMAERAMHIHSLISNLQKDISKAIKYKDYIKHYVIEYGSVPMWVLVNAIPLNRLSSFYSLMNQSERVEVSKYWGILEKDLRQYIHKLAFFRNLCAHDERIYCAHDESLIPDTNIHTMLNIKKNSSNNYIQGKNDFFSLVIVLKKLLLPSDFINFFNKLHGRILSLETKLESITTKDILYEMGFPENWGDIKKS